MNVGAQTTSAFSDVLKEYRLAAGLTQEGLAFAAAWVEGRALPLEAAVALAPADLSRLEP